jgi:hypothetical protein
LGDAASDDGEVRLDGDLSAERRVGKILGGRPHRWPSTRFFESDETRRETASAEEELAWRDESFGDLESPRVVRHTRHL